jgi:calmodulin
MYILFQYDTDGSGQIEFPEFCNMMSHKMSNTDDEEMVRLAFRTLDKDGSGSIATSEFKHLMTHIGKLGSKECYAVKLGRVVEGSG